MHNQELQAKYDHKTHNVGVRPHMCNYRHGGVFHAHKKRALPPSGRFSALRAVYPASHLHVWAVVCAICIVYMRGREFGFSTGFLSGVIKRGFVHILVGQAAVGL